MNRLSTLILTTFFGLGLCWAPQTALAKKGEALFKPQATIGQWKQTIKERKVKRVEAQVRRTSGSNKTFVNLRFGRNGKTFENGRRIFLTSDKKQKVVWKVDQAPNGEELIMNAYDGKVFLQSVKVVFH